MTDYEARKAAWLERLAETGVPPIVVVTNSGTTLYAPDKLPEQYKAPEADPAEVEALVAFEAEQIAAKDAEFARFKARSGQPSFKAGAVKVAAEKLGVLDEIEAAIDVLVSSAGDKSLRVWWDTTDTISRGDAQWQEIEAAAKGIDAEQVFSLAGQI